MDLNYSPWTEGQVFVSSQQKLYIIYTQHKTDCFANNKSYHFYLFQFSYFSIFIFTFSFFFNIHNYVQGLRVYSFPLANS